MAPLAYWKLDGNTADSSGNHPLALAGAPTYSTFVPSAIGGGRSLSMNATLGDEGAPPDTAYSMLNVSETSFSVSLWFTTDLPLAGLFSVEGANGIDRELWIDAPHALAMVGPGETIRNDSTERLFDGQWHHIALVFDAGRISQRLYLDGVLRGVGSVSSSTLTAQDRVHLGYSSQASWGRNLTGSIDDVSVWSAPLSPAQVAALYAGVSPLQLVNVLYDPLFGTDDEYVVRPDTPLSVVAADGVLRNDVDREARPFTAVAFSNPQHGTLVPAANGSFTYTPAVGYEGLDEFTYQADNGQSRSSPVTVRLVVSRGDNVVNRSTEFASPLTSNATHLITPNGQAVFGSNGTGTSQLSGAGQLFNYGLFELGPAGTGTLSLQGQSRFENHGQVSLGNAGHGTIDIYSTLINTGAIESGFTGNSTIFVRPGGMLLNQGTLQGGSPSLDGEPVAPSNVFLDGSLDQPAGGILITDAVSISASGQFVATGIARARVINAGQVRARPGVGGLAIEGRFTQAAGGLLAIDIAGRERDLLYGSVHVSRDASVAGKLRLNFIDGFVPIPGDTFTVLSARTLDADPAALDVELVGADPQQFYTMSVVNHSLVVTIIGDVDTVPLPPATLREPLSSFVHQRRQTGVIGATNDVDRYTLPLDAGQRLTLRASSKSGLIPTLTVLDPQGQVVGSVTDSTVAEAELQNLLMNAPGNYTIEIGGRSGSLGRFDLEVLVNASFDANGDNNSATVAIDLQSSFMALPGGRGDRGAVVAVGLPAAPQPVVIYSANMSTNPGWTLEGSWQFGVPLGQTSGGSRDPTSGFTGPNVIGYNLAGGYPGNLSTTHFATTPYIVTSGYSQVRLSFYRWLGLGYYPLDNARIEVTYNGGPIGATVWANANSGSTIEDQAWALQEYELSALADNRSLVQIRWGLGPTVFSGAGWNIDDVVITGVPTTATADDWYRFTLDDGQSTSIALAAGATSGMQLNLFNSQQQLVAAAAAGPSGEIRIGPWVDPTNDGAADTYYLQVSGARVEGFNLLVTRDAVVEVEPNATSASAQTIIPALPVLAHLGNGVGDTYAVDDGHSERSSRNPNGGDILWLNALGTPGAQQRITAISLAWASWVDTGRPAKVLLYEDPNDDGNPSDAILLEAADTAVALPGTDQFTDVPIWPTLVHGRFFVAALYANQQLYDSVAPLDSTESQNSSWVVFHTTPGGMNLQQLNLNSTPPTLTALGNYLIRAKWSPLDSGEDWYLVAARAGDSLSVETSTPGDGAPNPSGWLDTALELHDPAGTLVASDSSGGGDGRNARFTYQVTQTGPYRVRVRRESDAIGPYLLRLDGATGTDRAPEAVGSSPAPGQAVTSFPSVYRVDMSEPLWPASVNAGDLRINGLPATAVAQIGSSGYLFTLNPAANVGDGIYTVEIPDGAMYDAAGTGSLRYQATFRVDRVGPRVVEYSLTADEHVPPGPLSIALRFDEPLVAASLTPSNVLVTGELSGSLAADQVDYDPASATFMLGFANLPDDRYALTLVSGPAGVRDLAGNALDGGNFVLPFAADVDVAPLAGPFVPVQPLGSLVYQSRAQGVLGLDDNVDGWEIPLAAGELLSVNTVAASLPVKLELLDPAGSIVAASTDSLAASLQAVPIAQTGMYRLRVSDPNVLSGTYSLRILVGAVLEEESLGEGSNGTLAASQFLAGDWAPLASGASHRLAVSGQLSGVDVDVYRLTLDSGQSISLALDSPESDDVQLQLLDAGGQLLAAGTVAGNADQVVGSFVPASSAGSPATYFARVTGHAAAYNLLVLQGAAFDTEGNNRFTDAQILAPGSVVLGHVALPTGTSGRPTSVGGSAQPIVPPAPAAQAPPPEPSPDAKYAPGRLLVKFKPEVAEGRRGELIAQWGGTVVDALSLTDLLVVALTDRAADVRAIARAWSQQPEVLYAEPDYIAQRTDAIPSDALFNRLFGLHNTGQIGAVVGADVDAPEAWEVATGSRRVVVASIDTGVDYNHPDLAPNIWTNPGEIPGDGIDNDGNGFVDDVHGFDFVYNDPDPADLISGHGTHTSGTIGAVGNNGIGVAGVNWNVQIMALRAIDDDGELETSDVIAAVNYMTKMKTQFGVNIVACNNSYGGSTYSQAQYDAIAASIQAGIAFVASAGNSNQNTDERPHYPASYDLGGIISVAATDKNDTTDSVQVFTNYGAVTVDLGAPGVSILSTLPGGKYGFFTGTSMSTPHVTGTVALLGGLDPQASVAEIKDAVLSSVDPLPGLAGKTVTGGRLNVARAVAYLADDYYRISLSAGQTLHLETLTPQGFATLSPDHLDPAIELFDPFGQLLASDDNSGSGNHALLFHTTDVSGEYVVRVYGVSSGTRGEYLLRADVGVSAAVVGRHIFYNDTSWDDNNAGANANDDNAIASDKTALLPGGTATLANYTSYSKGINGIMLDVARTAGTLTVGDFAFKVGNVNNTSTWTVLATAPSVSIRPGAGVSGSDRITLIWPDGTIKKQWLQVTVQANSNTGLPANDVFYFGNAIGEAGNSATDAQVNAADELAARGNPRNIANPAPVTFLYDYNRDKLVNSADQLISRGNPTNVASRLLLITPSTAAAPAVQPRGQAPGLADAALVAMGDGDDPLALRLRKR